MPFDFEEAIRRMQQIQGPMGGPQGFGPTPPAPPIFDAGNIQARLAQAPPAELSPAVSPQAPDIGPTPPEYQNFASQRLQQLLSSMPQRQDPGIIGRIGGVMTGIAHGPEEQEKFMFRDYGRKLQDWNAQVTPTLAAANQERQMNALLGQTYSADRRADTADKRASIYEQRVIDQGIEGRNRSELSRRAQDLKELVANRPDLTFKTDENNEIVGFDSKGGPIVRSGIKSNELSDAQKINMGLDAALTRIRAAGDVDAGLAGLRSELDTKRDAARIKAESDVKAAQPQPPSQQKVEYYNKAQQAANTIPDAGRFIELGVPGTNDFKLKVPFAWRQGTKDANTASFEKIAAYIYGPNWKAIVDGMSPGGQKDSLGIRKP